MVDATNTSTAVPYAVVGVSQLGTSLDAAADGTFKIQNLQAGQFDLSVSPGPQGAFWPSQLTVSVADSQTTSVVVALVPQSVNVPDLVIVSPSSVTTDPGGSQQFSAQVFSGSVMLNNVEPSWAVEGGVGTITPDGVFTASTKGTGEVLAYAGSKSATSDVTVTGPMPPKVYTVLINPTSMSASGGKSLFTVHAADGDGVASVTALVYAPTGGLPTSVDLTMTAGEARDGTWAGSYTFPRNTSPIDSLGNQQAQEYDVRFQVRDTTGASTLTSFYQVTVQGLEAPPPPGP